MKLKWNGSIGFSFRSSTIDTISRLIRTCLFYSNLMSSGVNSLMGLPKSMFRCLSY